jgi:hypothetical protein
VNKDTLLINAVDRIGVPTGIAHNAYYLDIATRKLMPLVDFSGYASVGDFFNTGADGKNGAFQMPRATVPAPDGSAAWYVQSYNRFGGVSALPMLPDSSVSLSLVAFDDFKIGPATGNLPPQVSADGKALLWGYLIQFGKS